MVWQQEKASAGRVFWGIHVNMIDTFDPADSRVLTGWLDETFALDLKDATNPSSNHLVFTESDQTIPSGAFGIYFFIHFHS